MGCSSSSNVVSPSSQRRGLGAAWAKATSGFGSIPDQYSTFEEVSAALRKAGLESSQLIVGVDFTKSNTWTGKRTFQGRNLHSLETGTNPYFEVLASVAKVLRDFDDDNLIPAYGFGDARTKNRGVFSFQPGDAPCDGLDNCLARYAAIAKTVDLAGPTNFAPLIRQAIELVRKTGEYHILVMVADGQVDQVQDTADAIVEASSYPLSIVMVGVGDGPWDMMETFDDELPTRRFDNFQFVDYAEICRKYPKEKRDTAFAVHALMEVPDQYKAVKQLGLLRDEAGPCPTGYNLSKHPGRGGPVYTPYKRPSQPLPPPPKSLSGFAAEAPLPPTLLRNDSRGRDQLLLNAAKGIDTQQRGCGANPGTTYRSRAVQETAFEPEQEY